MVSSRLFKFALAFGLGLVLLVVSCAPAAEPTAVPTTVPPTATAPSMEPTAAPPTPTPTPVGGAPRRGGTLLFGGTSPISFAAWEECCSSENKMVADSVLQYIPANKFLGGDEEIEGRLSYEWSVSKDSLSWTLKLQKGATAALPDGTYETVDCDDVAWSIMTIKTGEGLRRTMRGRTFVPVTGVECPDPLTAVVKTKTPYGALPGMLAVANNSVLPKDYWKDRLKELPARVVGSGPWKMESFIADEIITYIPNPRYHRVAPDGKPFPYLSRVEHRIFDAAACGSAIRTGRVHSCGEGYVFHASGADTLYKEAPHLQFVGPFRVEDNPEWGSKGFLGTNPIFLDAHKGKAPWSNVKVREALSLALDRKTLCDISIEKWCQPGGWVFQPGSVWGLPRKEVENYPGYNIYTVEANQAQAKQILQSLGYELYPSAKALSVDLPTWLFTGPYIQAPTVAMLRAVGFNPNMYVPERQRVLSQVVSGEFEVVGWDQAVAQPDPNQICYEHYYTGSDRNYGRYSSAKADELCNMMGAEIDRTKRIALSHQFNKIVLDDHARATFLWRGFAGAFSPDIRGWRGSSWTVGGSNGRIEDWWLVK
ncbi:MAG: ABC transporter substrate-binding protein [Chloroflexi bacterium]|nr:ABC transporter substrate-binding protein [Chloroflexota bacterium]